MPNNEVKIVITGDASKLGKALGTGEQQLDTFAKRADALGSKLQRYGAAATVGVTVPLLAMGASAVKAFMEAEQAQAQLDASLKSTGATAWTSSQQIDQLASSMQDKLAVDGDLVKSGASVLLTFTKVRNEAGEGNDVFDQATQLAADLSAKLGTDLTSANLMLGKALNDPISGMTALSRAGVQLTESQREQVRAFVESGDVLSAQKVILGELTTQLGGSAEAFANTTAGKLEKAKLQFEDIQEEIGAKLIPTLSKLGDFVSGALDGWDRLGDSGQNVVLVLAGIAAAAGPVTTVVGSVMRLGEQLSGLKGKLVETSTAGDVTTTTLTRAGQAASLLGAAGAAFAVYQLAQALNQATEDALGLETALNNAKTERTVQGLQDVAAATEGALDKARDLGAPFGSMFADPTIEVEGMRFEIDNLGDTLERIKQSGDKEFLQFAIDNFRNAKVEGVEAQAAYEQFLPTLDQYQEYLDSTASSAGDVAAGQGEMAGTAGDAAASTGDLAGVTAELPANFDAVAAALDASAANLELWMSGVDGAAEAGRRFSEVMELPMELDSQIANASQLGSVVRGFGESIKNLPKDIDLTKLALGGYNEEQQASIDALVAAGDANTAYLTGLLTQGRTAEDVSAKADELRNEYLKQAEQLGLNDEQTQRYLDTLDLTPEKVTTAIELSKVAEAEFKIRAYQGIINATPPSKLTNFNAAIARGDYIAAAAELDRLARPRAVNLQVRLTGAAAGSAFAAGAARLVQADGGVVDYFAGGGFAQSDARVAQIAPAGAWRVWAEPETGGEAYIPLASSKRARSLAIWAETGRRLGVAAAADGGSSVPPSASGMSVAPPPQVTVNIYGPVAEDSEDWIAQKVEAAVAKGTRFPRLAQAVQG